MCAFDRSSKMNQNNLLVKLQAKSIFFRQTDYGNLDLCPEANKDVHIHLDSVIKYCLKINRSCAFGTIFGKL